MVLQARMTLPARRAKVPFRQGYVQGRICAELSTSRTTGCQE
jgi:hypothetical protein